MQRLGGGVNVCVCVTSLLSMSIYICTISEHIHVHVVQWALILRGINLLNILTIDLVGIYMYIEILY